MKKCRRYCLLGCATVLITAAILLNLDVTIRQGMNYKVRAIKMPLYLKLLDFFDRHYNYEVLVKKIVSGSGSDEDKAMRIFKWTCENIRNNPKELPVIDDHVWHIIVRGYGVDDQFQDVFTTLCNYVNLSAFFHDFYSEEINRRKPLSFVKVAGKWVVFDAYNGVYFINRKGQLCSIADLIGGDWVAASAVKREIPDYYGSYFKKLNSIDFEKWRLSRGAVQSPLRRFMFFLKNPKEVERAPLRTQ